MEAVLEAVNHRDLEDRILMCKRFLNSELTSLRTQNAKTVLNFEQIGHHLDTIHEIERTGVRRLNDMHVVKIRRTLVAVEACMNLSKN